MEHLVITADNASIPNFAFRNNALLKSVCVTGENITVGSYAFYKCTNLDTVLLLGEVSRLVATHFVIVQVYALWSLLVETALRLNL